MKKKKCTNKTFTADSCKRFLKHSSLRSVPCPTFNPLIHSKAERDSSWKVTSESTKKLFLSHFTGLTNLTTLCQVVKVKTMLIKGQKTASKYNCVVRQCQSRHYTLLCENTCTHILFMMILTLPQGFIRCAKEAVL